MGCYCWFMTTWTYTQDQIESLNPNRWTKNDTVRYYLNNWAELAGIDVGRYKSGGIHSVGIPGIESISNRRAAELLTSKVWFEDGTLRTRISDPGRIDIQHIETLIRDGVHAAIHPTPAVENSLEEKLVELYRTTTDGAISVAQAAKTLCVSRARITAIRKTLIESGRLSTTTRRGPNGRFLPNSNTIN